MAHASFSITKEDAARMAELAGIEFSWMEVGEDEDLPEAEEGPTPEQIDELLAEMAGHVFSEGMGEEFAQFAGTHREQIARAAFEDERVAEMLVLCYRFGIASGSASCMNDLGALYYMGQLVEQDYEAAAELYEAAADNGCHQSVINLGYIYEYGRTGEPDYEKAFQFYALANALAPSSEAAYKLGDMYSRGKGVPRDLAKAHVLYERSLELAQSIVQAAQPAVRIAKMLLDPDGASYGVEPDPLRALTLYQQAEVGLRIDIADGQTYYRRRLQEAIEGQARAREFLEQEEQSLYDEWK